MKKLFFLFLLANFAIFLPFALQAQDKVIGIYKGNSTSSSSRIFRYDGSILYSGSSPTMINTKRFFMYKG